MTKKAKIKVTAETATDTGTTIRYSDDKLMMFKDYFERNLDSEEKLLEALEEESENNMTRLLKNNIEHIKKSLLLIGTKKFGVCYCPECKGRKLIQQERLLLCPPAEYCLDYSLKIQKKINPRR